MDGPWMTWKGGRLLTHRSNDGGVGEIGVRVRFRKNFFRN